jgi:hypothetical protein
VHVRVHTVLYGRMRNVSVAQAQAARVRHLTHVKHHVLAGGLSLDASRRQQHAHARVRQRYPRLRRLHPRPKCEKLPVRTSATRSLVGEDLRMQINSECTDRALSLPCTPIGR